MKNLIVKYGIYGGIILVAMMLLSWFLLMPNLSYQMAEVFGYISMFLALSMIFFGMRAYRKENGDILSFGKGMQVGTLINLIPSGFMFIYTFFLFQFKGEDFLEWSRGAMSPEELAAMDEAMATMPEWIQNPAFQGVVMFATVFIFGLIITLLSAVLLRKS